jgi:hypothetical protein
MTGPLASQPSAAALTIAQRVRLLQDRANQGDYDARRALRFIVDRVERFEDHRAREAS